MVVEERDGATDLFISDGRKPARLRGGEIFLEIAADRADEEDVGEPAYHRLGARTVGVKLIDGMLNREAKPWRTAVFVPLDEDKRWKRREESVGPGVFKPHSTANESGGESRSTRIQYTVKCRRTCLDQLKEANCAGCWFVSQDVSILLRQDNEVSSRKLGARLTPDL